VKNWWKTISNEKKLDIINWLEKCEWIVDICCDVRLTHSSIHAIVIMLIELKKLLSLEVKCLLVWQDYHSPIGINRTKGYGCECYIFIALEINK
jgi:hypothetical protein